MNDGGASQTSDLHFCNQGTDQADRSGNSVAIIRSIGFPIEIRARSLLIEKTQAITG
jgi:hypothetical protein